MLLFLEVALFGATFSFLGDMVERVVGMQRKKRRSLEERIIDGEVGRQDVVRRLAELAFGRVNDCVRLALEEMSDLDELDLSLLSEVRRNEKGLVEIKLIDRLQVLKQLAEAADEDREELGDLLRALQGGGGESEH